jgi:hypothetical protein
VPGWILEFCNTLGGKKQYDIIFLDINLIFFYLTKNGLIVGDKILTYHMKDKCNYYNTKSF